MPNNNLFAEDFSIDPEKNYLEELVGEGKKFESPEELARGKAEADAFIARLENEQQQLRDELNKRLKLEEFRDLLNSQPSNSNQRKPDDEEPQTGKSAMSPEEIERLLEERLNRRDAQQTAMQNVNAVKEKLQGTYGPNYAQHLKRQAAEIGMTEQEVERLAASNPKVLFKLFGVDEKKTENDLFSPPRNQTTSLPKSNIKGDSYYEKMRKDEPDLYWSPKIQNEIFAQMKELGADLYYKS